MKARHTAIARDIVQRPREGDLMERIAAALQFEYEYGIQDHPLTRAAVLTMMQSDTEPGEGGRIDLVLCDGNNQVVCEEHALLKSWHLETVDGGGILIFQRSLPPTGG